MNLHFICNTFLIPKKIRYEIEENRQEKTPALLESPVFITLKVRPKFELPAPQKKRR